MIDASAAVKVGVDPGEAYAALSDLEHATWLPGIRGLRHVGGPRQGAGSRYEVDVGLLGRQLHGILVCTEAVPPRRTVMSLEDGLDLTITGTVAPVGAGCRVEILARYSLAGGLPGRAIERASAGPARREVARAVEQLAEQLTRRARAGGA
jgi:carbon monoxide dehydrogenase subunit G